MPDAKKIEKKGLPPPLPESSIAGHRRILFTIVLIFVPLIFLVSLELSLRIFSYGGNVSLVIRDTEDGKAVYRINRIVARRYFSQRGIAYPSPHEETFEIVKPPRTIRIFCVGESTMQGFPYEENATPPAFLRDRIQAELPGYRIEVINVGLSAVGSYVVKDFINELAEYEPDLYVVYVGHNEFYGAYGPGSSVVVRGPEWLTRLSLFMLRFKTFLVVRDGYSWLVAQFGSSKAPTSGTLMTEMVGKGDIPYHGTIYQTGLDTYGVNLKTIIESARDQHVPLLMSTVVSNIGDQPPFRSLFADSTPEPLRRTCTEWMTEGDRLMHAGKTDSAVGLFRRAVTLDSTNAIAWYRLGKGLETLGLFDEARRQLVRAKDMDGLRFRATEEFQGRLIQVCEETHTSLSRVDSTFEAESAHGIVGYGLILEHLHPNIIGYFLMAKTWAQEIRAKQLLGRDRSWIEAPDDSTLMNQAAISPFDRAFARIRIENLTHHWPFPAGTDGPPPSDPVEKIAYKSVHQGLAWSQAKFDVAEYYSENQNFEAARKEMLGVAHTLRVPYLPLARIGDYFAMEQKYAEAESLYRQSVAAKDNSYAHMSLGVLYEEERRTLDGLHELEEAFALNAREAEAFSISVAAYGRVCLAKAYAGQGRTADARREIEHAMALDPNIQGAQKMLQDLDEATGR